MTRKDVQESASQLRKIDIEHVMPGADIISSGNEKLALGFPEEVVKSWMGAGASPTAWLVPDVRTASGVVQWALEFPLYYALFIQGLFAKGDKIRVLCHEQAWSDIVDYLRLTLLGLTADELSRAGVATDDGPFRTAARSRYSVTEWVSPVRDAVRSICPSAPSLEVRRFSRATVTV